MAQRTTHRQSPGWLPSLHGRPDRRLVPRQREPARSTARQSRQSRHRPQTPETARFQHVRRTLSQRLADRQGSGAPLRSRSGQPHCRRRHLRPHGGSVRHFSTRPGQKPHTKSLGNRRMRNDRSPHHGKRTGPCPFRWHGPGTRRRRCRNGTDFPDPESRTLVT